MFYSQFILAKKGPLGTIWIAAHLERKLRKNQVADTDIGVSVDSIIFPDVPIALRLSSHLLLGVVRIYSRKVNYLFDDCSETLLKIKQAFRSAAVDLPPEESKAPYHSITLPETFGLDDFELPDTDFFQGNYVDHHVSAKEQITLQDTMEGVVFSTSQFGLDERFGDEETCQIGLDLNEDALFEKTETRANDNSDPQASVHPMTPLDADKDNNEMIESSKLLHDPQASVHRLTPFDADEDNNEMTESSRLLSERYNGLQMEVLERNSEPTDFAEAPSTPMLVVEANLSSVQDALASDEHVESGVPNLAERFPVEDRRHISRTDIVDDPLSGEMTIQQDEIHPSQDCTAYISSIDGANSVTLPTLDHDGLQKPMSLESRPADYLMKNVGGPDGSNAIVWNEETTSCIGSQTAGRSEELLAAKSDGALQQKKCDPEEVADTVEKLHPPEKASAVCQLDSLVSPDLDRSKMDMLEDQKRDIQPNFGFQACSSNVRHQEETSFAEVENDCAAVDVIELDCDRNRMSEFFLHGQETDIGEHSQQCNDTAPNDRPKDKCDMNLDLSAPEKLLSVPTELADKPNILLPDSTPYKEYFQEGMANNLTEIVVPPLSNSLESSGLFQSKQTIRSIPDDDDLLSSILVGRMSSVLKMNPSPVPLALTPAKRVRNASRASTSKRKVLMDDSMVLHGDVIRLQLINTDDLRRARKKAPCTLSEISILRRQFLEDEIFSESTHPGLSRELSYMQKGVYDLRRLKICEFIEPISPTAKMIPDEPNLSKETKKEENEDPMSFVDGGEARAVEIHLIDNHQDSSLASGSHTIQFEVESLQLESNDRIDAMEIDEETVAQVEPENSSAVSSFDALVPVDPVFNDLVCLSVNIDSNMVYKEGEAVEGHAYPSIAFKTECIEKNSYAVDLITEKGLNAVDEPCDVTQLEHPPVDFHLLNGLNNGGLDEIKPDSPTDHCLMASHDVVSAVTSLAGVDGCSNMILEESGEAVHEVESHNPLSLHVVDEEAVTGVDGCSNMILEESGEAVHEVESHNPLSLHVVDEEAVTGKCSEPRADFVHQLEHEGGVNCPSLPHDEIVDVHDSHRNEDLQTTNDLDDLENIVYGNDTEFLNVDDDEVDDDNEHVADGQESLLLDNSGWSSRTRAVAKYLQMLFDKEECVRGRSILAVDSLLAGKTRKEASRMFFESLVLKTKDYIHVEQEKAFDNIALMPRRKLMKSIF